MAELYTTDPDTDQEDKDKLKVYSQKVRKKYDEKLGMTPEEATARDESKKYEEPLTNQLKRNAIETGDYVSDKVSIAGDYIADKAVGLKNSVVDYYNKKKDPPDIADSTKRYAGDVKEYVTKNSAKAGDYIADKTKKTIDFAKNLPNAKLSDIGSSVGSHIVSNLPAYGAAAAGLAGLYALNKYRKRRKEQAGNIE